MRDAHPEAGGPRVFETHISVVFLVGDRAYKLKKPVKTGFLDYSTAPLRAEACRREVEVNRRLAPDVYLGVAELSGPGGREPEPLVVMRRLPEDRCLDDLVRGGGDVDAELRQVTRAIADFHSRAERSERIAGGGSVGAVLANWEANFDEMQPFVGPVLDASVATAVERLARAYLAGRHPLFSRRLAAGCVVDGHGDLRAENIFCLADGPRILDAIEFSDALRHNDVLLDVAFLAMDLERLGREDLAALLLQEYREFTAETHPASLEHHYIAYRAHVRTKVACLRHAQGDADAAAEARRLLEISASHLRHARVRLVLLGGAPGTGKSTLAAELGDRTGFVVLRSDIIRKELAGLGSAERGPAELYSPGRDTVTYGEMLRRARELLEAGESVVLDATWREAPRREAARELARDTFAELVEVEATAPPEVARRRLVERETAARDASDAGLEVGDRLAREFDAWPEATSVSTAAGVREALEELERLGE